MEDSINAKTQIIVEDDISKEKLEFLIDLKHEEERLDYKEKVDTSNRRKSIVDLVCDIISMANSYGGYLVFGVSEENNDFKPIGTTPETLDFLKSENIKAYLEKYVENLPLVKVRNYTRQDQKFCIVYIGPTDIPIPFRIDGEYSEANKQGRSHKKFRTGDLFVRHITSNEKASFRDWQRFAEKIRKDERKQNSRNEFRVSGLNERIDQLILAFGGDLNQDISFDVSRSSLLEIESYFYKFMKSARPLLHLKRVLKRLFNSIRQDLESTFSIENEFKRKEALNRISDTVFPKILPIWLVFNETVSGENNQSWQATKLFSTYYYSLYEFTYSTNQSSYITIEETLFLQFEIIKLSYVLGAISLLYNSYDNLETIILQKGLPGKNESSRELWYRTIQVKLSREELLEHSSLLPPTFDTYRTNDYLMEVFDNEVHFKKLITQADYYQCLKTYLNEEYYADYWPSFRVYEQDFVEELISRLLFGSFTDEHKRKIVAGIEDLRSYGFPPLRPWRKRWNDDRLNAKISELTVSDNS